MTHLEVYVGVEYLCPEAHGRRLQRVLLRHVERQLKSAAFKRRVSGPLHVTDVRQVVLQKRSTRALEGSCLDTVQSGESAGLLKTMYMKK